MRVNVVQTGSKTWFKWGISCNPRDFQLFAFKGNKECKALRLFVAVMWLHDPKARLMTVSFSVQNVCFDAL